MSIFGQILGTVLWLYWLVLIARLVLDFARIFRAILAASGTASVDRRNSCTRSRIHPYAPFDG